MPVRREPLALAAAGFASLFVAAPAFAACQPGPVRVALPAQPLDERLQALAHLTGCAVDVAPALPRGQRAPALAGRLTTDEAFVRSVKGTGLEAGPNQGHWRVDRDQQTYFARRIATTEARITARQKAGRLGARQAATWRRDLAAIRAGVPRLVRDQGFLSAAERSSYTAMLDRIDRRLG